MWPRECSCDILMKNVAPFCPCQKSLPEGKWKSFGLVAFTEEITKQISIDCAAWMLVDSLVQIFNKKEQAEQCKTS